MRTGLHFLIVGACLFASGRAQTSIGAVADAAFAPITKPTPLPPGVAVLFGTEDNIADRVVTAINSATNEILVNQNVFTNGQIARALVDAFKRRKITVVVLLDPSPRISMAYQTPGYFAINGVPVFATTTGATNNNKYLVIDRTTVVTGSFDFTEAATRNDENLLIISEAGIAGRYYNHFVNRLRSSKRFDLQKAVQTK